MRQRVTSVTGPDDYPLYLSDLPPPDSRAWGLRMKARVVAAVEGGLLTVGDACARYSMSLDEYRMWKRQTLARNYPNMGWLKQDHVKTKVSE